MELIRISASAVILLLAVRSDFSDGIIRNQTDCGGNPDRNFVLDSGI